MVIVTMDDGSERVINLADHTGYKQADGKYRVTFKDARSGIVTQNPAPENSKLTIIIKPVK